MLSQVPDVLGPASGTISDSGVTFNDGVRTYWFGSEIAKQAAIQQNGIRVAVDGSIPISRSHRGCSTTTGLMQPDAFSSIGQDARQLTLRKRRRSCVKAGNSSAIHRYGDQTSDKPSSLLDMQERNRLTKLRYSLGADRD